MVTTPTVDADAFQPLGEIFQDNAQLRFDELLVRLETESRGVFLTLWGDQPVVEETGRTDEKRATDDAAMLLVYPVNDVTKVETKKSVGADWKTLDSDRWDFTDHRLILANRQRYAPDRRGNNDLTEYASRATWRDIAAKVRVTYDRGFDPVPGDIKSVQIQMINQYLRKLRREQTTAAASPEELAGVTDMNEVVTDEIRQRVSDVTSPGGATMSV